MTIETLDRVIHAQPFKPFSFMLADGRRLPVRHPDFVAFNPKGRVAVVMDENDGADFVDLLLVVSLNFEGSATPQGAEAR